MPIVRSRLLGLRVACRGVQFSGLVSAVGGWLVLQGAVCKRAGCGL